MASEMASEVSVSVRFCVDLAVQVGFGASESFVSLPRKICIARKMCIARKVCVAWKDFRCYFCRPWLVDAPTELVNRAVLLGGCMRSH